MPMRALLRHQPRFRSAGRPSGVMCSDVVSEHGKRRTSPPPAWKRARSPSRKGARGRALPVKTDTDLGLVTRAHHRPRHRGSACALAEVCHECAGERLMFGTGHGAGRQNRPEPENSSRSRNPRHRSAALATTTAPRANSAAPRHDRGRIAAGRDAPDPKSRPSAPDRPP